MKHKNIKMRILLTFLMLLFFSQVSPASAASLDTEEQAFVDLLNDYRESLKRTELKVTDPLLNGTEYFAQNFSENPNDSNVCIHVDTSGDAPEERGQKYGYYFLAENMGWGYETGQAIFDAWKASEGHRENMISSGSRTIGVARYYNADAVGENDCNGNVISSPWFWVLDLSDEGVERLNGNNLKTSEIYSSPYRKMTVTIKKWSKKYKKYKKAKWAEIKVYDQETGQLLDHDIGNKKGQCAVYVLGSTRAIEIKVAKFKGGSTVKFTLKGKLSSKGKVNSKKTTLNKDIKYEVRIK